MFLKLRVNKKRVKYFRISQLRTKEDIYIFAFYRYLNLLIYIRNITV